MYYDVCVRWTARHHPRVVFKEAWVRKIQANSATEASALALAQHPNKDAAVTCNWHLWPQPKEADVCQ